VRERPALRERAFVAKLSADGSAFLYSTLICGRGTDVPSSIAIDAAGHAYVGGITGRATSDRERISGRLSRSSVSLTGFVLKLLPDASDLVYSTYLGGSTNDSVRPLPSTRRATQ
jgi:hypothetical protein